MSKNAARSCDGDRASLFSLLTSVYPPWSRYALLSTEGDLERAFASTDASGREDGGLKAEQLVKDHCKAVVRLGGVL